MGNGVQEHGGALTQGEVLPRPSSSQSEVIKEQLIAKDVIDYISNHDTHLTTDFNVSKGILYEL